eukprot:TRINITY_DN29104_c0_g1_i1.p1 TRINITY_DN29104_c0_g1~~TRINITY_DN29104_c0_g1_i1.p1  ORF type:complete len:504 (+),score=108.51 TRINITY_DN29104_c0_g1_i1:59-1570(+)
MEGSGEGCLGLKPMDPEEFRENAHKMVDFIADYYRDIHKFPVRSQVQPGYLQGLLPDAAPEFPETFETVLGDIEKKIMPGITHWQSPNFFSFFPSNSSTAGLLGEMLSGGLNIVGFSWITSPAATELETIVLDWLGKMLKLPDCFLSCGNGGGNPSLRKGGGVIQGTASEAILVALLAARDKALKKAGITLEKLVAYGSDQTHSSLKKACMIAGLPKSNVRALPTDKLANYALSPVVLQNALLEDIGDGLFPFFLSATVGTTSSSAVDSLSELGKIAMEHNLWFHVDAAYAGAACICPEYRHYLDGVEMADSFSTNAHKWLLTNFDCSALWVKDSKAIVEALSTNPEFLRNKVSESKQVIDYKDWQVPLGRRFRSLKLWMVLRLYGVSNLQSYIRNHIALAKYFEELVKADSRFEIVAPRTFSLVCFRLLPLLPDPDNGHRLNSQLLESINNSGKAYLSHTVLDGTYTLRLAVGAPLTKMYHIDEVWSLIQEQAKILLGNGVL